MLSGEPDEYARVPTVLRAFIRYAPAEREVSPTLTLETLEVVDRFEGAFLDKRDSPEVVAARAELAAAFEEIAASSARAFLGRAAAARRAGKSRGHIVAEHPAPSRRNARTHHGA